VRSSRNPFEIGGTWYRGNTHCHTTTSDGEVLPSERIEGYRQAGYDFLVLTDHGKINDPTGFPKNGFLTINGAELHPENPFGGDAYHIVAMNLQENIPFREMGPQEVLDAVRAQGGEAIMAHPHWLGYTLDDYRELSGYIAMEVFNETTWQQNGTGESGETWDQHLDRLGPVWGVAADDAHGRDRDTYKAWVMVRAPKLTVEAILAAMRSGAFYSTQGPTFKDITVGGGPNPVIEVQSSPVRTIVFKGRSRWGQNSTGTDGGLIDEATYVCNGMEKYVRIELIDQAGRRAWSNPFYVDG